MANRSQHGPLDNGQGMIYSFQRSCVGMHIGSLSIPRFVTLPTVCVPTQERGNEISPTKPPCRHCCAAAVPDRATPRHHGLTGRPRPSRSGYHASVSIPTPPAPASAVDRPPDPRFTRSHAPAWERISGHCQYLASLPYLLYTFQRRSVGTR